jgi:hypothetical protein
MNSQIKIMIPAVVLIAAIAVGGAYMLNGRVNSKPSPVASNAETDTTNKQSAASFDELVNELNEDATSEAELAEKDSDASVKQSMDNDAVIINSAGTENYDTKF